MYEYEVFHRFHDPNTMEGASYIVSTIHKLIGSVLAKGAYQLLR